MRASGQLLQRPSRCSVCLPDGRATSNLDEGPLDVGLLQLGELKLLDLLLAALHLGCARAGVKARDEVLKLADLLRALRVLLFDLRAQLGLRHHHLVVGAGVDDDRVVVDVGGVRADGVQEVPIVGDDHEDALVAGEEALEPADRVEVEVVGGLVEEQRLGLAEERLGEEHAELQAAGELAHRPVVLRHRDAEPGEQLGRVRLGGIAVLLGDDVLELAEALSLGVGDLGEGEDRLLLLHRGPERPVAHQDDVEHPSLLEAELVLLEDGGPLRAGDRAVVGLEHTLEDLHEGRLAGAVRPGEAVALAGGEGDGDVVEEALAAVGLGDADNLDRAHWGSAV